MRQWSPHHHSHQWELYRNDKSTLSFSILLDVSHKAPCWPHVLRTALSPSEITVLATTKSPTVIMTGIDFVLIHLQGGFHSWLFFHSCRSSHEKWFYCSLWHQTCPLHCDKWPVAGQLTGEKSMCIHANASDLPGDSWILSNLPIVRARLILKNSLQHHCGKKIMITKYTGSKVFLLHVKGLSHFCSSTLVSCGKAQ